MQLKRVYMLYKGPIVQENIHTGSFSTLGLSLGWGRKGSRKMNIFRTRE